MFIVVWFLIHIPFVDFVWSPHLDAVQLDDSAQTRPKWRNLLHGTMRTSFRWVFLWRLNQTWLVYLLPVCHTCIWGTTTGAPQCNYHQAAFSSCWMARVSQVKIPHGFHNTLLKSATTVLGKQLREFRSTTCSAFQTCELPKEVAARGQHQAQKQAKVSTTPSRPPTLSKTQPKTVSFNASTYKVHALGDYASTVMMYGPTDSYSTQTVISINTYFVLWANLHLQGELEHRRVKKLYSLTNKNGAIKQMTRHECRETRMWKAQHAFKAMDHRVHPHHIPLTTSDPLPYTDPRDHHHMSKSRRHYRDLFSFAKMYPGDPATKVTSLVC